MVFVLDFLPRIIIKRAIQPKIGIKSKIIKNKVPKQPRLFVSLTAWTIISPLHLGHSIRIAPPIY